MTIAVDWDIEPQNQTHFGKSKKKKIFSFMIWPIASIFGIYSRTPMSQTLMAYSPGLARTIIMVPPGHFMHNQPWMSGTTLG